MVNIKGGKKHKKYAKNKNDVTSKRKLIKAENELEKYAKILKPMGNNRFQCQCIEKNGFKDRLGVLRGKMRKRVWIKTGDFVLISLRGFQDEKCDIIYKYNMDEVSVLIKDGDIRTSYDKEDTSYSFSNGNGSDNEEDNNMAEIGNNYNNVDEEFDYDDI